MEMIKSAWNQTHENLCNPYEEQLFVFHEAEVISTLSLETQNGNLFTVCGKLIWDACNSPLFINLGMNSLKL